MRNSTVNSLIKQLEASANKPTVMESIKNRVSIVATVKPSGEVKISPKASALKAGDFPVRGDYAQYMGKIAEAYITVTGYINGAAGDGETTTFPRSNAIDALQKVVNLLSALSRHDPYTVKKSDLAYITEVMVKHGRVAVGGNADKLNNATEAAKKYGEAEARALRLEMEAESGDETAKEQAALARAEAEKLMEAAKERAISALDGMTATSKREFVTVNAFRAIVEDCISLRLNGCLPKLSHKAGTSDKLDSMRKTASNAMTPEKLEAKAKAEAEIHTRAERARKLQEEAEAEARREVEAKAPAKKPTGRKGGKKAA